MKKAQPVRNVANVVMARFRLRNETAKEWAQRHGFKLDTVYKTIYGTRGKAERGESLRIKEGLRRDGFWPEEEDGDEAVNL